MKRAFSVLSILLVGLLLSGCGDQQNKAMDATAATDEAIPRQVAASEQKPMARGHDFATVMRGARLYANNCATCHGAKAQGDPNWRIKGANGKYPPPPLNGTGHAWHHQPDVLKRTIRDGTVKIGGSMPSWRNKLANEEMDAIIAWLTSLWPEEVYKRWSKSKGHH